MRTPSLERAAPKGSGIICAHNDVSFAVEEGFRVFHRIRYFFLLFHCTETSMMTFQMVAQRDSDRGIIAAAGAAAVDVLKMTPRGKIIVQGETWVGLVDSGLGCSLGFLAAAVTT